MRIERLTLAGFKSFGDRVTLTFAPGVSAVVGPNGSGKSNVLDALRWATGGGRAQAYRASDKTDLIFHGASGKKRMGRAEVEVELRDGERRIRIRRSVDRDGVTRLHLNGRPARFLDVDEALAGSGLGKSGLAVIGQGEVASVLMADPARLLAYVAEAAGVAQLASRRERTEARLDAAEEHLERLLERAQDDRDRIAALTRDAQHASEHDELQARARRLRLTRVDARRNALTTELEGLESEIARTEAELSETRVRETALRSQLQTAREADRKAEAAQREAAEAYARAQADLRIAQHTAEAATTRAADLAAQRERAERERDALADLEAPTPAGDDLPALEAQAQQARTAAEAARERTREAERRIHDARNARETLRQQTARAERDAAEHAARREALEQQLADIAAQSSALMAAGDTPDGDAVRQDEPTTDAEGDVDPGARARASEGRLQRAEQDLAAARSVLEAAQSDHAREAAEARALARAAERLRAATEARRGYAEGPRHALASGVDGVIGSVADVLQVPSERTEAIALALGRRAEWILTRDAEVARTVLEHVRQRGGFVTLLPLDLVRAPTRQVPQALLDTDGVLGVAADLVRCEARYREVSEQLLGGTVLVKDDATATALAHRFARRPRLVSFTGAVLEPGGALSGGKRQAGASVLAAAADLAQAEQQLSQAEERERDAAARVRSAQAEFVSAKQERDTTQARADEDRRRAAAWREERAAQERLAHDLKERERRLQERLAATPPAPEPVPPERLEDALREEREAETAWQEALAGAEPALAAVNEAERALDAARDRQRAYQAAWQRYQDDQRHLEEAGREAERLETAVEAAWTAVRQAETKVETARAAVPSDTERVDREREQARDALRALETALDTTASERVALAEALERARVQAARREATLEQAEEERRTFAAGLDPLPLSDRAAREELRDVEERLERIGAVNHRAAAELRELQSDFESREAELTDATAAVAELRSTVRRLDQETNERLRTAVAGLRDRFVAHVAELFGPDALGDVDTDEEEGRPVGLRIRLQPPGKRTESLNLLSVGERTMGALAFLFALMAEETGQAAGGLPLAVLDEVDAPLDEANIRRYRTFLERSAARGTQFVLITHQKATFEAAAVLWGVTSEGGVSRVFSMRRELEGTPAAPIAAS